MSQITKDLLGILLVSVAGCTIFWACVVFFVWVNGIFHTCESTVSVCALFCVPPVCMVGLLTWSDKHTAKGEIYYEAQN